jgi:2-polyprenyl-3-methyl-5-hydroxy-6-metoxy-1,4-benzoquinol methylase
MADMKREQESRRAARRFLQELLIEMDGRDALHSAQISKNISEIRSGSMGEFNKLLNLIFRYFKDTGVSGNRLANDYLRMVGDMRREQGYFMLYDKYSCKNQQEAYEKVYSQPEVMRYYMNALFITQLLWTQHFNMLQYFKKTLHISNKDDNYRVLDVGAGHGLFSWIVKSKLPDFGKIDILDLSVVSLTMTREIIGEEDTCFLNFKLSDLNPNLRYELIILGEILEHMDDPALILRQASRLLSDRGMIFLTVPTNAPAIDHVYLFQSKGDVLRMIDFAGLQYVDTHTETVDKQTQLIGAFCIKK